MNVNNYNPPNNKTSHNEAKTISADRIKEALESRGRSSEINGNSDTITLSGMSVTEYLESIFTNYDGVIDLREVFPDIDHGPNAPTHIVFARINRVSMLIKFYHEDGMEHINYSSELSKKMENYVWEATGGRATIEEIAGISPEDTQYAIDLFEQTGKRVYVPENSISRRQKSENHNNYAQPQKPNLDLQNSIASQGRIEIIKPNGDVIDLKTRKLIRAGGKGE
jgi:hypothetical protein